MDKLDITFSHIKDLDQDIIYIDVNSQLFTVGFTKTAASKHSRAYLFGKALQKLGKMIVKENN